MKLGFSKHETYHLSPLDDCEMIAEFTSEEKDVWKKTEDLYIALQNLLQLRLQEKKVITTPPKKRLIRPLQ